MTAPTDAGTERAAVVEHLRRLESARTALAQRYESQERHILASTHYEAAEALDDAADAIGRLEHHKPDDR